MYLTLTSSQFLMLLLQVPEVLDVLTDHLKLLLVFISLSRVFLLFFWALVGLLVRGLFIIQVIGLSFHFLN